MVELIGAGLRILLYLDMILVVSNFDCCLISTSFMSESIPSTIRKNCESSCFIMFWPCYIENEEYLLFHGFINSFFCCLATFSPSLWENIFFYIFL